MFFRKIGLTLAIATVSAFTMAALTLESGATADAPVTAKRQDRLVPAGGFKPATVQNDPAYGNYTLRLG